MVHVGEERFYRETYDEAFAHDVVLVEGMNSPVSRNLARSYRWLSFGRLGLVVQPKTPPQESVAARIVHADLSGEEFHREWRKISPVLRAAISVLAPLYGAHRRFFGSRERLAHNMCLEDRRSAEEVMRWSPGFAPVDHSILHARDERLIACLAAELDGVAERSVAIVYGAQHMRAVSRALTKLGFHCSEAGWRTIFSTQAADCRPIRPA